MHFASLAENEEDWVSVAYLMDTATQAGIPAQHIDIESIGWDASRKIFVDLDGAEIKTIFKLYPWEWMMREPFGAHIAESGARFVELMWKAVLSCKGILAILWELFPGHPNLLPAYFDPHGMAEYVKKPLYSREGANVEICRPGLAVEATGGRYGAEGHVFQQYASLPTLDGFHPIVGSWVVGDEPAGMCIREDRSPVTGNLSAFVPHYFD